MSAKVQKERTPQGFINALQDEIDDEVYGITELSESFSLTPRAIRFYESKGLLRPKRVGNTRVYSRREHVRLQLILRGKSLGLSLDEIKEYLDLYGERGEGRQKQLELVVERTGNHIHELLEKKKILEQTIDELSIIRSTSQKRLRALKRKNKN
ncbi:MAG: MerR family DNA-binding transcriptional regulator [Deltaproteobacteria bacterium]|nr:MerR family DNA-binding transcriptional regulator [Deltaproteobacteria bacterium]